MVNSEDNLNGLLIYNVLISSFSVSCRSRHHRRQLGGSTHLWWSLPGLFQCISCSAGECLVPHTAPVSFMSYSIKKQLHKLINYRNLEKLVYTEMNQNNPITTVVCWLREGFMETWIRVQLIHFCCSIILYRNSWRLAVYTSGRMLLKNVIFVFLWENLQHCQKLPKMWYLQYSI